MKRVDGHADAAIVASPCTSVCTIDVETRLCAGCYRTIDEIAGWINLSAAQRRVVIGQTEVRRLRVGDAINARRSVDAKR
jgi:uncharacterized protein